MSRYSISAVNTGSDPCCFRLLERLTQFALGTSYGVELLPDLAGHSARPAGADLSHVDEVIAFTLAKVERGDATGVLYEADDRTLSFVDSLDLQPAPIALRPIRSVSPLGNDANSTWRHARTFADHRRSGVRK